MIFVIKGFWSIIFIFIVISITFRSINPPVFWRCLSNSGTYTEKHRKKAGGHIGWNVVEITIKMKTIVRKPLMIKINKLRHRNLDNKNMKKAGGHIGRNVMEITIKMKTIVWKPIMIKISGNRSKRSDHHWYHRYHHTPQIFYFFGKFQLLVSLFDFIFTLVLPWDDKIYLTASFYFSFIITRSILLPGIR